MALNTTTAATTAATSSHVRLRRGCGGASMGWHSCRLDFSDIVWICAKARGCRGGDGWYLYGRTPPPARFGCGKHVGCASRCIHAPDPSANSMMRSCRLGQPPSRGACTLSLHQSELELGPTSTAPHPASLAPIGQLAKSPPPTEASRRGRFKTHNPDPRQPPSAQERAQDANLARAKPRGFSINPATTMPFNVPW